MLQKFSKYFFLTGAILFFTSGSFIEYQLLKKHPEKHLVNDFQKMLNQNEAELKILMETVKLKITTKPINANLWESLHQMLPEIDDCGKAILVYKFENLEFWSDRAVSFFDKLDNYETHNGIIQLRNGYYLITSQKVNEFNIIGLLLIKRNYIYENKYLKNDFYKDYNLPENFRLLQYETNGSFPVKNINQDLLFYLKPMGDFLCTKNQLYLPAILYFLGLILLLYYFRCEFIDSKIQFGMKIIRLLGALAAIYWIHILFGIPKVLFYLKLFSPDDFANNLLPSLGDFFILALFFLFWIYCFISELNIKALEEVSKMSQKFIVIILLVFCCGMYLFANFFIEKLILDSTISFNLNQITSISVQSIIGIISDGLFLAGLTFLTLKISSESKNIFSLSAEFAIALLIAVLISFIQYLVVGKPDFTILSLFVVSTTLAGVFRKGYLHNYLLSYLIVFVSAASLYSIIVFYHTISQKERELQKLLAVTLVTERDPAAEVFLGEIQNQIVTDSRIPDFIVHDSRDLLPEYLEQTYFNGYFRKFDTRIYICSASDSLTLEDERKNVPCIPFFEEKFSSNGLKITGTGFYFMDNMNGRISYAGNLYYPYSTDSSGIFIFVELDSELLFEGIGFPELLIDNRLSKPSFYSKFSYAKYYGGELTDKSGDYNYNTYVDSYVSDTTEYQVKKHDGLEHLIYNTRLNNYIIVSRKAFTFIDYLISFPYLFVFYIVIVLLLLFTVNYKLFKFKNIIDLKFKIQMAIIAIVFISLLVVAIGTLYYNVEEYRFKHKNDLNEKLKSIAEEIDMRFEDKLEITPEMIDWLNRELLKLSNIFRTDINIYDQQGIKLSSSRSEIFARGLVSDRINSHAKFEVDQSLSAWFQPEKIGQMSYLSAYQPIVNKWGDILGIINLPYFVKQDGYSQEISTFIVAFINLYVLLLLVSIILAVFIANQITKPLVDIQKNLQKMELGKPNEPILYKRNDEIGSLVKEYNKKVEELAISAELLARSERETAWRDMAKQIAHEIKNPLTPMKLNIQYLQKVKTDTKEYYALIEKVSATLIEQIDNLSNIATEFSNFAQIPTARNQVFNLAEQLQKVIDLYETNDQSEIIFIRKGDVNLEVNADREQLGRAVINLIKNGIQAIPDGQPGRITVSLEKRDDKAVISVNDNGTGIPEDLRSSIFSPSFTTKTSGMGLGLAIVKNIVENFYGTVRFETVLNEGTTFFIEMPIYQKPSLQ